MRYYVTFGILFSEFLLKIDLLRNGFLIKRRWNINPMVAIKRGVRKLLLITYASIFILNLDISIKMLRFNNKIKFFIIKRK